MNSLWFVFMRKEKRENNSRPAQPVSTIKVKKVQEHNRSASLLSDGLPEPSIVQRSSLATWWGGQITADGALEPSRQRVKM